jgi:hypothetical protein
LDDLPMTRVVSRRERWSGWHGLGWQTYRQLSASASSNRRPPISNSALQKADRRAGPWTCGWTDRQTAGRAPGHVDGRTDTRGDSRVVVDRVGAAVEVLNVGLLEVVRRGVGSREHADLPCAVLGELRTPLRRNRGARDRRRRRRHSQRHQVAGLQGAPLRAKRCCVAETMIVCMHARRIGAECPTPACQVDPSLSYWFRVMLGACAQQRAGTDGQSPLLFLPRTTGQRTAAWNRPHQTNKQTKGRLDDYGERRP